LSSSSEWRGYRELHITPDWLLIYRIVKKDLILVLVRTGSHKKLISK
jgi:mRNA interferase YafQ